MVQTRPLIFLVYDGVENAVFAGQVISPLMRHIQKTNQSVYVISFECRLPPASVCDRYRTLSPLLHLIIMRRLPFFGTLSLRYALWQVRSFLHSFTEYELVARGPFAGWIALNDQITCRANSLTVQARGLAAQEYVYQKGNIRGIQRFFHRLRAHQLERLERQVFSFPAITIQAVTTALRDYLQNNWAVDVQNIQVAQHDIPELVDKEQVLSWRMQVRQELAIAQTTYVYVYHGSSKSWQRPEQVIQFFKHQQLNHQNVCLLILSPDYKEFERAVVQAGILLHSVRVRSVQHHDIYRYLAAADAGLLFREEGIISWVSRPVKALEYEAVGLPIIHNGTVQWLNERYPLSEMSF